jgi:hypothetical protein
VTADQEAVLSGEDIEWMDAPMGPPRPSWATQLGQKYDDAFIYARAVARQCGYALARHGSEVRDFDLIAVPWTAEAVAPEELAERIRAAVKGVFTHGSPAQRPHGRQSWAIHLPPLSSPLRDALAASSAHFEPYLDLSVFPPMREPTNA